MIADLVVVALSCVIAWVVSYLIYPTEVDRKPGPGIADPTPPTLAEISYDDPRIPLDVRAYPAKLGKRIVAGENPPTDTSVLWYNGPLLDDVEPAVPYDGPIKALLSPYESGCSCPHAATHGHLGGCALDTNPHYSGHRFARGGIVQGGTSFWLNEPMELPSPRARETRRDPITGEILNPAPIGCQHPNPESVVLTTDEVVAGVCPDCLQPLPPSSVGSEWKP